MPSESHTRNWAVSIGFDWTHISMASPCGWCTCSVHFQMRKLRRNWSKTTSFGGHTLSCSKPSVLISTYSTWDKFSSGIHLNEIRNCYVLGEEFLPSNPDRQTTFGDFSSFISTVCLLGLAAVPCVVPDSHRVSSVHVFSPFAPGTFAETLINSLSMFELGPESCLLPLPALIIREMRHHCTYAFVLHSS